LSFIPSDALAAEGRRLRASASSPGSSHPQSQAARDGLSEAERKVQALLVRIIRLNVMCGKPAVVRVGASWNEVDREYVASRAVKLSGKAVPGRT